MIRVVLDTNVLVSAILSPQGKPAQILKLAREEKIELLFSAATTKKLWDVLHYHRITARLKKLKVPLSLGLAQKLLGIFASRLWAIFRRASIAKSST